MAYSKLEDAIVNNYFDVNYLPPDAEEPSLEGMQLAAGPSSTMTDAGPQFGRGGVSSRSSKAAGGLEKPLTGLADLFAGFARGATAQTLGLGGDLEQLYNGFASVFNRPEDQGRIDAFLKGVQQKTNMATTEQVKKEGFRVPGTDINVPALPPTIPAGAADEKSRKATAAAGETFGEFAPLPGAIEAGVTGLKYGTKALAPTAATMMESGLRKSGMIMDIAPSSPTVKTNAPISNIGFYSAVENAAANIQRKSGSGQSFLNDIIKGENVKAEEIKWIGLDDFLKEKKNVTKQEVQDYIANNKVDVQEVRLGESVAEDPVGIAKRKAIFDKYEPQIQAIENEYTKSGKALDQQIMAARDNLNAAHAKLNTQGYTPTAKDYESYNLAEQELNRIRLVPRNMLEFQKKSNALRDMRDAEADAAYIIPEPIPTKFGKYTLPGGENYRELILTMPRKSQSLPEGFTVDAYSVNGKTMYGVYDSDGKRYGSGATKDAALKRFGELHQKDETYTSSHFPGQENPLVHFRVNDRVDADGKKMLLIEEVQSDWHQAGRDKGYTSTESKAAESAFQKYSKELANKYDLNPEQNLSMYATLKRMQPEEVTKYEQLQSAFVNSKGGVLDAPFKDTWYQLALKRAIQYAAENGYERIGLTTGKQQADRYKMSNEVNTLAWRDAGGGVKRSVSLDMVNGENITLSVGNDGKVMGGNFEGKSLSSVIGKDLSNKIMSEDAGNLAGEGLNIGGEGMKKYYDEIYPKFLDKYGKKWGAKVGETTIETGRSNVGGVPSMYPDKEQIRYLDITPEMKAGVSKGQPLFAAVPAIPAAGLMNQQKDGKK